MDPTCSTRPTGASVSIDYLDLREAEARYRNLAEHSPDWEFWLGEDGRFEYVSPACEAISGYPPAAYVADANLLSSLIHPDDHAAWTGQMADGAEAGACLRQVEARLLRPDGAMVWIEAQCQPIRDEQGIVRGRCGVIHDITRRKHAEDALRELAGVHATLSAVNQAIVRGREETQLLDEVCQIIVEKGALKGCVVSMGDVDDHFYPLAYAGLPVGMVDAMPLSFKMCDRNPRDAEGRLLGGCPDCDKPDNNEACAVWSRHAGIRSCCHLPLYREGERYGLVSFMSEQPLHFQGDVPGLLEELVQDIGYALTGFNRQTQEAVAKHRLAEREKHLAALLKATPVGIALLINRVFADVNEHLCALLGYEAAELIGESARMIYPDEAEYERVGRVKYAAMAEGGVGQIETRFLRKDGAIIDVLMRSMWLDVADPSRGVVSTILDITPRKVAEEALRASEEHYRLLAEHVGDIIAVLDFQARIRFITPACTTLLGYRPEEMIGGVMFDVIDADDQERVKQHFAQLTSGEVNPGPIEVRVRGKDGRPVWMEAKADLMVGVRDAEVLAVVRDISGRKAAESAAAERQARYEQLFEHMSDGVAVYEAVDEGEDFVFKEFNRASEAICGLARAQVIGRRLTQTFPDIERSGLLAAFRRVWRGGAPERLPVARYEDDRFATWVENYVFRLDSGEIVAIYQDIANRLPLPGVPPQPG